MNFLYGISSSYKLEYSLKNWRAGIPVLLARRIDQRMRVMEVRRNIVSHRHRRVPMTERKKIT